MKVVLDVTLDEGADPEQVADAIFDLVCANVIEGLFSCDSVSEERR